MLFLTRRPLASLTQQAAILCALCAGTAQGASFVSSFASCTAPGQNNQQGSATPGATSLASLSTCSATSTADWGILRGSSTTSAFDTGYGSYNSQFYIEYFLTNPALPANTQTTLIIPLDYHVNLGAGVGGTGNSSTGAVFTMYLDSAVNPFWLINFQTTSDIYGANICPSPAATFPRCNGNYMGTLAVNVPAVINGTLPNRFWITMVGSSFNPATSDASNTVTIGASTLAAGLTVSYPDISGNPLNLQNASSGVPEPAAVAMVGAALIAMSLRRRIAK